MDEQQLIELADLPDIIATRWRDVRDVFTKWRNMAKVNEAFVYNRQHALTDSSVDLFSVGASNRIDVDDDLTINLVGGLMTSWAALITKDRQCVKARPGGDDPVDIFRCEVANKLIRHLVRENKTATLFTSIMQRAAVCGVAGVKVFYSNSEDRIRFEEQTIHDFFCDTRNGKEPRWIVFETLVTKDEAEDELTLNGIDPAENSVADMRSEWSVFGDQTEGYLRQEIWELPSRERPEGLFGVVVGGVPVYLSGFPEAYSIRQDSGARLALLPIVLVRMRDIRRSVFGATTLSSAIPVQRSLNRVYQRIDDWVMRMKQYLVLPKSMQDNQIDEDSIIWSDTSRDARETIFYVNPQDVPPTMSRHAETLERKIYDIIGINEVSSSNEVRAMSGVAIRNMRELDIQKNADSSKALEAGISDAFRLALGLIASTYSDERIRHLTGGDLWSAQAFMNAEIDGADIQLEPSSEVSLLQESERLEAAEAAGNGSMSPDEAAKRIDPGSAEEQQMAESMVDEFLSSGGVEVDPTRISMGAMMQATRKAMARAQAEGNREDWMALRAFMVQLRSLAAQQGEEMPAVDPDAEQPQLNQGDTPGDIPTEGMVQ